MVAERRAWQWALEVWRRPWASSALAASVAAGRLAIGVGAVASPDLPLRWWVDDADVGRAGPRVLARALGGRDAALAVGALRALVVGGDLRPWVAAGGLADAIDAVATIACWAELPSWRRRLVLTLAGGAATASLVALRRGLPQGAGV